MFNFVDTGCPQKNDPTLQCHIFKNIEFDVFKFSIFGTPGTCQYFAQEHHAVLVFAICWSDICAVK